MIASRYIPADGGESRFNLVLLHAFPVYGAMWDRMLAELSALRDDVSTLVIDAPGFGASPAAEQWTMEDAAQDIHHAMEQHSIARAIVAGVSMGGYEAFAFYRMYPAKVEALVLSNTSAAADTDAARTNRHVFAEDALRRGAAAAMERLYPKFVTENTDPEIARDIRQWISEARPEAIAAALGAMAARPDSTDLLRLISKPSLVISSTRDEVMPVEKMREMAAALRRSSFVTIEGAAHLTPAERPREWAEALSSFMDRLPTRA